MAEMTIDLTGATTRELLPIGKYNATIASVKPGTTKESNLPKLDVQLTVDEPGTSHDRRTLYDVLSTHPRASWKMVQFLTAAGAMTPGQDLSAVRFDTEQLIGAQLTVTVGIDEEKPNPNNPSETYPARNKVSAYAVVAPHASDPFS